MKKLILTNIENKEILNDPNTLLLGDWMREDYEFDKKIKNKNEIFDSGIFTKQTVYNIDKEYREFKLRLFKSLIDQLNVYHKTNFSRRYWQIILEPWYTHFFETILYRWKIIEKFIETNKKSTVIFVNFKNSPIHFDYDHFIDCVCQSDYYNQYIFQEIINILDVNKNININIKQSYEFKIEKKKIKKELIFFHKIFSKIFKNKNYFIDLSIGIKKYLLLNLYLRDFPYKDKKNFSVNKNNILFNQMSAPNKKKREQLKLKLSANSLFEKFLIDIIHSHLPVAFLEDFKKINENINSQIKYKPKCIVSDMNYATNTFFKFWLAKSINQKVKVIITDHGGSYGLLNGEFINEQISDQSFRYYKSKFQNSFHVPLIHKLKKRGKKKLSKLLVITHGVCKYPHYVTTSPVSGQVLNQIETIKKFYDSCNEKIKKNFFIRPNQLKGWYLNDRYKDIFGNRVQIKKHDYEKVYDDSKIIISTYPKTSFYESFLSGPSILLTNLSLFKITKEFDELHNLLKANNMLFENALDASNFVNKVWDNVDEWWYSKKSQDALKVYSSFLAYEKKNSIKIWSNLIRT